MDRGSKKKAQGATIPPCGTGVMSRVVDRQRVLDDGEAEAHSLVESAVQRMIPHVKRTEMPLTDKGLIGLRRKRKVPTSLSRQLPGESTVTPEDSRRQLTAIRGAPWLRFSGIEIGAAPSPPSL